jgi:hypothetical protein
VSYFKDLEPALMDTVKNKNNETTGVVITKFPSPKPEDFGEILLDVRGDDNTIYYSTPAKHWEVTALNDE